MSKELKSAFEIDGFLEGKTNIVYNNYQDYYYYVQENKICFSESDKGRNQWTKSQMHGNTFLEKAWSVYKPKMYIHEYWYKSTPQLLHRRIVRTSSHWDEFIDCDNSDDYELIKTTEVEA